MIRDQTWDELARFLDTFTFEDRSRFELHRDDESNYAVLYAFLHAPNTYSPLVDGKRGDRYTRHEFVVPVATYNYETWRRWVFERLKAAAIHEVCEWFMDDGVRVFAPHHGNGEDPYIEWYTRPDRAEQVAKAPGDD